MDLSECQAMPSLRWGVVVSRSVEGHKVVAQWQCLWSRVGGWQGQLEFRASPLIYVGVDRRRGSLDRPRCIHPRYVRGSVIFNNHSMYEMVTFGCRVAHCNVSTTSPALILAHALLPATRAVCTPNSTLPPNRRVFANVTKGSEFRAALSWSTQSI